MKTWSPLVFTYRGFLDHCMMGLLFSRLLFIDPLVLFLVAAACCCCCFCSVVSLFCCIVLWFQHSMKKKSVMRVSLINFQNITIPYHRFTSRHFMVRLLCASVSASTTQITNHKFIHTHDASHISFSFSVSFLVCFVFVCMFRGSSYHDIFKSTMLCIPNAIKYHAWQ